MADKNTLAAVAYVLGFITGIIVLLIDEKKDKFVKFHAMQSILFSVAAWIISFLIGMILVPFGYASIISGAFTGTIWLYWTVSAIYGLIVFVLWVVLILKAYSGQTFKLPVIGDMAENLAK